MTRDEKKNNNKKKRWRRRRKGGSSVVVTNNNGNYNYTLIIMHEVKIKSLSVGSSSLLSSF